jgi:AcrR family transcriptional regulator
MDINSESSMEQSILDAAEKLFLEKGFAATSTTQIAKEVGCNQALVHYYFRTKDNLFNRIFEKKFSDFFQVVFDTNQLDH